VTEISQWLCPREGVATPFRRAVHLPGLIEFERDAPLRMAVRMDLDQFRKGVRGVCCGEAGSAGSVERRPTPKGGPPQGLGSNSDGQALEVGRWEEVERWEVGVGVWVGSWVESWVGRWESEGTGLDHAYRPGRRPRITGRLAAVT
jgi:hypothetical protein